MEARKTYSIGETNSFSGSPAAYRHLKPGNFLTGCSSSSFPVELLPLLPNTKITYPDAIDADTLDYSDLTVQVINHKIPVCHELNFRSISVNKSTSIVKSYSCAHWACCYKLKKSNKFDCTITPSGRVKHRLFSENHNKSCTLGEVAALPDFLIETATSWNADGKKPIAGAKQTPKRRPEIAACN